MAGLARISGGMNVMYPDARYFDQVGEQFGGELRKTQQFRQKVSSCSQQIVRSSSHFFRDNFRLCRTTDSEISHFPTLPTGLTGTRYMSL